MTTVKPPLPTTTLENSRRLRRDMTDAEQKLWQQLRGGQLDGLKFRRQHPIPPYIADFCCVSEKLIVELDGSQHDDHVDAARSRYLEAQRSEEHTSELQSLMRISYAVFCLTKNIKIT